MPEPVYSWVRLSSDEGVEYVLYRDAQPCALLGPAADGSGWHGEVFAPDGYRMGGNPVSTWQMQAALPLTPTRREALALARSAWDGASLTAPRADAVGWRSWEALGGTRRVGEYDIHEFQCSIARARFEDALSAAALRGHLAQEHGLPAPPGVSKAELRDLHARDHRTPLHTHEEAPPDA